MMWNEQGEFFGWKIKSKKKKIRERAASKREQSKNALPLSE